MQTIETLFIIFCGAAGIALIASHALTIVTGISGLFTRRRR